MRRLFALRSVFAWTVPLAGVIAVGIIDRALVLQFRQLFWRWSELGRALHSLASIAAAYPLRTGLCIALATFVMLIAEFAPGITRRSIVRFWILAGFAASLVYVLSALDVAYVPAVEATAGVALLAWIGGIARDLRVFGLSTRRGNACKGPVQRTVLPILVGFALGVVLLRASLEVVTEWDALIYHASFARDWASTLPGLPSAAGPSLGAEMSYNYPALFSSIAVVGAKGFGLSVVDVLRWISPLAAISIVATSRAIMPRRASFSGWVPGGIMLCSAFFVSYAEWPTAYALLTLYTLLIASEAWRRAAQRSLMVVAALMGLLAVSSMLGVALVALIGVAALVSFLRRSGLRLSVSSPESRFRPGFAALLLVAPFSGLIAGSIVRTHAVLFPWVTWPDGNELRPHAYWQAGQTEIINNAFGQYGDRPGAVWRPLAHMLTYPVLFPGGLLSLVVAATLFSRTVTARRFVRTLLFGLAAAVGAFLLAQLVWPRYFLVLVPVGAVVLARAVLLSPTVKRVRPPVAKPASFLRAFAAVLVMATAGAGILYGAALGLAGPNDFTFTVLMQYSQNGVSPFETVGDITNVPQRLRVVFGEDARAWSDTRRLTAIGLKVGTFDVRNFYVPYTSTIQLDGLAGSRVIGTGRLRTIQQLQAIGAEAVFVPSWFWNPSLLVHPLASWSPVLRWVGASGLSAVRAYVENRGDTYPSMLYGVGDDIARLRRVLAGSPDFSVAGGPGTKVWPVGRVFHVTGRVRTQGWLRMAAPVSERHGPVVRIRAQTSGSGLSIYEPSNATLFEDTVIQNCAAAPFRAARTAVADFEFPGSPLGFSVLDVSGPHVARLSATLSERPWSRGRQLLVRACGDPVSRAGGFFPAGSSLMRLLVLNAQPGSNVISFKYRDIGTGAVTFNAFDFSRNKWVYGIATVPRCGTGRWLSAEVHAPSFGGNVAELAPVIGVNGLQIRDAHLRQGRRDDAVAAIACGDATTAEGALVHAGTTTARLVLKMKAAGHLALDFWYRDNGTTPVSFNLWDGRHRRWLFNVGGVERCASGAWLHTSFPIPNIGSAGQTVLAPVVPRFDLRLRDLRVVSRPDRGRAAAEACGDPTSARGGAFPASNAGSRILVTTPTRDRVTLAFEYLDERGPPVSFNVLDRKTGKWAYDVASVQRCGLGGWRRARIALRRLGGKVIELGPVVHGTSFEVRRLRVVASGKGPSITAEACGDPTARRPGFFTTENHVQRLDVTGRGRRPIYIDFDYWDGKGGSVSFNAFDARTHKWLNGVAAIDRCDTRNWLHARLEVPLPGRSSVEVRPVVRGTKLLVRNLRLDAGRTAPQALARSCGDPASSRGGYFTPGSTSGRLLLVGPRAGLHALSFDYFDDTGKPVFINALEAITQKWAFGVDTLIRCRTRKWVHVVIPNPLPGQRRIELGPVVSGTPFRIRNLRAVNIDSSPRVSGVSCGNITTSAGGVFPAKATASRIVVDNRGKENLLLDFDYRDDSGAVSFNAFDTATNKWLFGVARLQRCGSGTWLSARLRLPLVGQRRVQLGPVVVGSALAVKNLRLVRAPAGPYLTMSACGDGRKGTIATFPAGISAGRLFVSDRGSGPLAIALDYRDRTGPVSFNAYDTTTSMWLFDVAELPGCRTGQWRHAVIPVPLPRQTVVELGPVVTGDPLQIRYPRIIRTATPSTSTDCEAGSTIEAARAHSSARRQEIDGKRSRAQVGMKLPATTAAVREGARPRKAPRKEGPSSPGPS
jgi:hypothetical protein